MMLVSFMPPRVSGTIADDWDHEEQVRAKRDKEVPHTDPVQTHTEQFINFWFSIGTLVDLAAILPSLVILFVGGVNTSSTSFIRIFRMFRIFKMSKQFSAVITVFRNALRKSKDALIILALGLVIIVIVLGTIQYAIEGGTFTVSADFPDGAYVNNYHFGIRESPYTSIPVSIYWATVTVTTVGYGVSQHFLIYYISIYVEWCVLSGDIYPVTQAGQAVACISAILGLFVIAMPVTVLGTNFSNEYDAYVKRQKEYREVRRQFRLKQKQFLKLTGKDRPSVISYLKKPFKAASKRFILNKVGADNSLIESGGDGDDGDNSAGNDKGSDDDNTGRTVLYGDNDDDAPNGKPQIATNDSGRMIVNMENGDSTTTENKSPARPQSMVLTPQVHLYPATNSFKPSPSKSPSSRASGSIPDAVLNELTPTMRMIMSIPPENCTHEELVDYLTELKASHGKLLFTLHAIKSLSRE
jgi:hypothetical protein